MLRTVEAVIDDQGVIRPVEPIEIPPGTKVLVTVLEETTRLLPFEAAFSDWNRHEEDEAWAYLHAAPDLPRSHE